MAKYLLLKHYRGAPDAVNNVPMDQWTPQEVEDHVRYMGDFAARLESTGEYVDGQALSPEGTEGLRARAKAMADFLKNGGAKPYGTVPADIAPPAGLPADPNMAAGPTPPVPAK